MSTRCRRSGYGERQLRGARPRVPVASGAAAHGHRPRRPEQHHHSPARPADGRPHVRVEPGGAHAGGRVDQPADPVHPDRHPRLDPLGQRTVAQAIGGTAYEFVSWSDGGAQTHNVVANASGSYGATYQVRTGGPVITRLATRPGPGRVTITWTTDVPADSQVRYGPTAAYGSSTALDRTLVTAHSVTITGLTRKSMYSFQVLSRDNVGSLSSATGELQDQVARRRLTRWRPASTGSS